jgi:nitroreductase
METWQAILRMRAVRSFADRPIEPPQLDRILRAGRRAASSKNSQRWAFVVCQERGHLEELSKVGPFAGHIARAGAAVAIVTPNEPEPGRREWIMLDAGQAAQNMMLAGWDIGVGSAHAAVYEEDLARELLGYPDEQRCDLIISFGYASDASLLGSPPAKGGRRPLDELIHRERW